MIEKIADGRHRGADAEQVCAEPRSAWPSAWCGAGASASRFGGRDARRRRRVVVPLAVASGLQVAAVLGGGAGGALPFGADTAAAAVSTCTAWSSSTTPPNTIKVLIYRNHSSSGAGSTKLRVDTVNFKTYVQNVLPNEWSSGWPAASLQAGAVASKQYAWYYAMNAGHGGVFNGQCYDVTDDISSQRYVPGTATTATNAAIDATWNTTLTKAGSLFATSYRANLTGSQSEACGAGVTTSPGIMSQWGSRTCALNGRNVFDILSIYYPGSQVVQAGAGSFVGMTRTRTGAGYYMLGRDGSIHPHGDAVSYGSPAGQSYFTGQRAVGMVLTKSGAGYWVLSAGGGIYSYGDAAFFGAPAGQAYFNGQTAVSMTLAPSGAGYWVLSAGGGIYSYGNAPFFGAPAGQAYFNGQTATGLTLDATGNGYWVLSASGGIYSYGDAPFFGAAAGQSYFSGQTAAGLTLDATGNGYWISAASGGVYSYCDAPFYGAN